MMLHFIRPIWLLLLIPAILYLVWLFYFSRQLNPWKKVCDPHLLSALLQSRENSVINMSNIALFLFFLLSIFALAGPAWNKISLPVYRQMDSLMIVLDLSSAMQATDLKPDRLTRAKLKIRDLINAADNTQMGLVVFTNEAFLVTPLTQDANTLNAFLDELSPQIMPIAGSDSGEGLKQGLGLLKQTTHKHFNLLLITASEPTANSWAVAKDIATAGGHLTILAMLESKDATQNTIYHLQRLANVGDGSFYLFSPDSMDIKAILNKNKITQTIKDDTSEQAYVWQDAGPWFCLLLIPLALVILREKISL